MRHGPGGRGGLRAAPPPGHRHPARAGAGGHRARGAVEEVPVLRRGHRGRAAARGPGAGVLRPGDSCAGGEPDLRELRPVRPGGGADGRDGRDPGVRWAGSPGSGRRPPRWWSPAASWTWSRELLRQAEAVHADETPARAAGGLRYVHLACTPYLTHMHTGDRSAAAVDAGGVLPGYQRHSRPRRLPRRATGTSPDALHAWCGAHLLARPEGPVRVRAREAGLGRADGRACSSRPATPPATPAPRGRRPWTGTSSATSRAATGPSPRPGWPRTSTGAPRPRRTRAGSPAGS